MPTRSGEPEQSQNNNEKKKSMAQANVKHNINTNLQSCNNFLQFFTSLHSCVLFHFVYLANSLILMRAVFFSLLFCQDLPIDWRQDLDFTSLILFKNNAPNLSSSVDSFFSVAFQFTSYCRTIIITNWRMSAAFIIRRTLTAKSPVASKTIVAWILKLNLYIWREKKHSNEIGI